MRLSNMVPLLVLTALLWAGCGDDDPSRLGGSPGASASQPTPPPTCAISAADPRGYGAGEPPVWLSREPVFGWSGPGITPVAFRVLPAISLLHITGHSADGRAQAGFAGFASESVRQAGLTLSGPFDESAPLTGYLVLPEPGCWRFEVDADGEKHSITIYAYGESLAADCAVSEPMEVRRDIAPGLGAGPVWMIAGAAGEWERPDFLAKTIWILDDAVQGPMRITGRQIGSDRVAQFQGYDGGVSPDGTELVMKPPHGRSKDRRGYVIYPTAGCWRFTAESEGRLIAEITQYLYDVVP